MRWVVLLFLLAFPCVGQAQDQDLEVIKQKAAQCRQYIVDIGLDVDWQIPPMDCREEPAESLMQALQYGREFWADGRVEDYNGAHNPACDLLVRAGLRHCNYHIRGLLVDFLTMYGVNLFPAEPDEWIRPGASNYSGQADENEVLMKAVRRNARLFADGDLTREEVTRWK